MWFVFGLVSLLGAASFFSWSYRSRCLAGTAATTGPHTYQFQILGRSKRASRARIGIRCNTPLLFDLKPERLWDRCWKWLGLATEQQLDNLHFDENIYVVSDDSRLSAALRAQPALANRLQTIFESTSEDNFVATRLICSNQLLWLEIKTTRLFAPNEEALGEYAAKAVPLLAELASALPKSARGDTGSNDHFIPKAALLVGLSTGMAINGALHVFRQLIISQPRIIENDALIAQSLVLGVMIWVALILLCIVLLGRSSRVHSILLDILFIGGFGALTSSYVAMRDLNVGFDLSDAAHVTVDVKQHYSRPCGKHDRRTCYYIGIAKVPGYSDVLTLQVLKLSYLRFENATEATVDLHEGAFGYSWIDNLRPVTAATVTN